MSEQHTSSRNNTQEDRQNVRLIPVRGGVFAIVDDIDYDSLVGYKWSRSQKGHVKRSVKRNGVVSTFFMHREVMRAPPGIQVDHIDHDPLNNRRSNLRFATPRQNGQNSRKRRTGTSRFKGVCFFCGAGGAKSRPWVARIYVNGKQVCLGRFTTETEAALAYNVAAQEHFREFALLNEV